MKLNNKYIIYFLNIFILLIIPNCNRLNTISIEANKGILNLEEIDFNNRKISHLTGEWEFYWGKFIKTDNIYPKEIDYINIPSSWSQKISNSNFLPSTGFATYKVNIILNSNFQNLKYAIKISDQSNAFKLYWNGKLISEIGKIGKNESDHRPMHSSLILELDEVKKNNELILEISNFSHSKGGMVSVIDFGLKDDLYRTRDLVLLLNFFTVGSLFIMFIYHFIIFTIRKNDYIDLSFSFFCLSILFRPITIEDRFIYLILPDLSWELCNKIEYVSLYSASVLFMIFFYLLYKKDINKYILFLPSIFIFFMIIGIIFLPTSIYSFFVMPFQICIFIQSIYVIFILIKIIIYRKRLKIFPFFNFLGFLVFFLCIVNDILHTQNIIDSEYLAHKGLIFFILLQSYVLSVRITKTFNSVEKLSKYLRTSNKKLITLKKNLQELVNERTKELKEKSSRLELVGRMTSMIVHDLKNPISSIIGFAELADDSEVGKDVRSSYLKTIEIEAYRLSDMSHDILDFVKGEFKIKKDMILIKNFIDEIQRFIYPDIKQYNINLILDINYIGIAYIDSDRLRRSILNIFSNSVDALISSSKERLNFSISTYLSNNFLVFELGDNGSGIPIQILDRLFEPFATYGKYNGTGLGMAQVKGIIEAHNGKIDFKTSSEGTIFYLKIPLTKNEI